MPAIAPPESPRLPDALSSSEPVLDAAPRADPVGAPVPATGDSAARYFAHSGRGERTCERARLGARGRTGGAARWR